MAHKLKKEYIKKLELRLKKIDELKIKEDERKANRNN